VKARVEGRQRPTQEPAGGGNDGCSKRLLRHRGARLVGREGDHWAWAVGAEGTAKRGGGPMARGGSSLKHGSAPSAAAPPPAPPPLIRLFALIQCLGLHLILRLGGEECVWSPLKWRGALGTRGVHLAANLAEIAQNKDARYLDIPRFSFSIPTAKTTGIGHDFNVAEPRRC
jgi:hypothetical protein